MIRVGVQLIIIYREGNTRCIYESLTVTTGTSTTIQVSFHIFKESGPSVKTDFQGVLNAIP